MPSALENSIQPLLNLISSNDSESSMFGRENRLTALDIFIKIKTKYANTLAEHGGVDNILNIELVTVIIAKINEILPGSGEHSAIDPRARKEFEGEIGQYHTALRALLDKEPNLTSHPSVLHKDAQSFYNGINFRELLAYYWLAASDAHEIQSEELDLSITNFINELADIRRTHNKGLLQYNENDSLSCSSGTFGRITKNCSPYNPHSKLILVVDKIPSIIQGLFIDALCKETGKIQSEIYCYLLKTLVTMDDVTLEEKSAYYTFLATLTNSKNLSYIFAAMGANGINIKDNEAGQKNRYLILQIAVLIKNTLDLENGKNNDPDFMLWFIKTSFNLFMESTLEKSINTLCASHTIEARKHKYYVKDLTTLFQQEKVRAQLVPKSLLIPEVGSRIQAMISIMRHAIQSANNDKEIYEKNFAKFLAEFSQSLSDDTPENIADNKTINNKLIALKATYVKQTATYNREMNDAIEISAQIIKDIQNFSTAQSDGTAKEFADALFNVISEESREGNLVEDHQECDRIINLLRTQSSEKIAEVISEIINSKQIYDMTHSKYNDKINAFLKDKLSCFSVDEIKFSAANYFSIFSKKEQGKPHGKLLIDKQQIEKVRDELRQMNEEDNTIILQELIAMKKYYDAIWGNDNGQAIGALMLQSLHEFPIIREHADELVITFFHQDRYQRDCQAFKTLKWLDNFQNIVQNACVLVGNNKGGNEKSYLELENYILDLVVNNFNLQGKTLAPFNQEFFRILCRSYLNYDKSNPILFPALFPNVSLEKEAIPERIKYLFLEIAIHLTQISPMRIGLCGTKHDEDNAFLCLSNKNESFNLLYETSLKIPVLVSKKLYLIRTSATMPGGLTATYFYNNEIVHCRFPPKSLLEKGVFADEAIVQLTFLPGVKVDFFEHTSVKFCLTSIQEKISPEQHKLLPCTANGNYFTLDENDLVQIVEQVQQSYYASIASREQRRKEINESIVDMAQILSNTAKPSAKLSYAQMLMGLNGQNTSQTVAKPPVIVTPPEVIIAKDDKTEQLPEKHRDDEMDIVSPRMTFG